MLMCELITPVFNEFGVELIVFHSHFQCRYLSRSLTAQSLLDNLLLSSLSSLAPTVDPQTVVRVGATEIRSSFPPDTVPGIVDAYLQGLRSIYMMIIAFAGVATLAAMANRWQKLNLEKRARTRCS